MKETLISSLILVVYSSIFPTFQCCVPLEGFEKTILIMPFSRELVPKFGTLFRIRLIYLNVRPFVKNQGIITKFLAVRR